MLIFNLVLDRVRDPLLPKAYKYIYNFLLQHYKNVVALHPNLIQVTLLYFLYFSYAFWSDYFASYSDNPI
jgi:hypothetical protein